MMNSSSAPSRFRIAWMAIGFMCTVTARANDVCDLDCSLSTVLAEEKLAGAVYGLVDGDAMRVGAVGFAHHPDGQPLRADAKVHVGSVAKTFIALGVLRLVTQKRVDLDAPLDTLLPAVRIGNPWAANHPVTLRHLLDHTSGLDDMHLWHIFTLRGDSRAPLKRAFDGNADLLRVRFEPGSRFSYSNMGYTLAAMAIESITAERYESWLDRELLGPLGMKDSTVEFRSQAGPAADSRLAWGHLENFAPVSALPVWLRPAAQMTTTAEDMLRAARFLLGNGGVEGRTFIDERLLRDMGRPASTDAAKAGLDVGYALGLATRDRHGVLGRCSLGNIVGFSATLCFYPDHDKAFFVSINTDSETADYARLDAAMVEALGVSSPVRPTFSVSSATQWRGRYVRAPARIETFRYFDLLLGSVVLDVEHDRVELRRMGSDARLLTAVGPNLLRAPDRTTASHVLLTELDGTPAIGDGNGTFRRVSPLRFFANWASLALGIGGLVTLLVLIPLRRMTRRERLWQPATFAWLLLLVPLPLFAMQPFVAIGDATAASVALCFATAALPLLMAAHLVWSVRNRDSVAAWKLHAASAIAVLQWCAVLAVWGLLPFATWA